MLKAGNNPALFFYHNIKFQKSQKFHKLQKTSFFYDKLKIKVY